MLSVDIYIKDSVYTLLNNLLKREQFTLSATPLLACVVCPDLHTSKELSSEISRIVHFLLYYLGLISTLGGMRYDLRISSSLEGSTAVSLETT
jgi:hypothetical protein